ncbi:TetR/AcrR family transcriptional regulator [Streptomyces sp. AC536]|uniref:TetR/AcrR family transcriptional regulator n=1 Tax=Streptomyces buecherae TaxID=2763006 RepID=UPI00164EBD69|nr:TetR/AcrR family transcriptional regulator [Streptomyces buecherae]MBC3983963.1 TetR/AcrR family transcriptional regulator [Streptomyces buecherae]QNJ40013.1 TetR/AcrR family transcriptional regulator [Streptomyces buecherae]
MAEGLRERKKRQTRQHISDVATGLFLERGFDAVTIAEIADAADVSVNTVYNYFPAKEDLFFDRSAGVVDRLPRYVRGREVGESAARSVLRQFTAEVEAVSPTVGLFAGYDRFMRVIQGAHALKARLWYLQQEVVEQVENVLREETGAAADDPLPTLVGGQLAWVQGTLMGFVGRQMMAGREVAEVSREALVLLDEMEDLLSERVLNYAVRPAP